MRPYLNYVDLILKVLNMHLLTGDDLLEKQLLLAHLGDLTEVSISDRARPYIIVCHVTSPYQY